MSLRREIRLVHTRRISTKEREFIGDPGVDRSSGSGEGGKGGSSWLIIW